MKNLLDKTYFLECLVKPLFIFEAKILQPQLPRPLQIETFTTKELGHRTKQVVVCWLKIRTKSRTW
jgi:hypothetical protein